MKFPSRKLLNLRNIIFLIVIFFIVIIGYNVFVNLKINEGLTNTAVSKIVIQPIETSGREWLNISEIMLFDSNGQKIPYTATATNGETADLGTYDNNNPNYTTDKLYDGNEWTLFHSKAPSSTLTIIPSNNKCVKIKVINRKDCCHYRLHHYQIVFKNSDNDIIGKPINFSEYLYLFDGGKYFTQEIPVPIVSVNTNSVVSHGGSSGGILKSSP